MGLGLGALRRRDRHRVERAEREDHVEEHGRTFPGDSVAESAHGGGSTYRSKGSATIGGNVRGGAHCKGDSLNMLSNHRIIFVLNIRPSIKTMHYYFTH
jgi:hypothetical protein